MEKRDLYKEEDKLRRVISHLERSDIAPENKQLVKSFVRDLQVDGIKALRIIRYILTLRFCVERWCSKPYNEWTEEDLKDVLLSIGKAGYKTGTVNEYRKGLRKFFSWHYGDANPFHKLLKGNRRDQHLPQTIDEDTVFKLIDTAKSPQDKALIATLYDGGFRVGELAGLTWQDIQFNEHGARVRVSGKTGERLELLILAPPYLVRWREAHPHPDPESYVFVSTSANNYGHPLSYQAISRILKKTAESAGIKTRIYPHLFRHSRATTLSQHLTEAQMSEYFGWVQGSGMPSVYVHLSGRDVDNSILKAHGIEVEEDRDARRKPKRCPRCNHMNAPTDKYCSNCAILLDEKERLAMQDKTDQSMPEIMGEIVSSPEKREELQQLLTMLTKLDTDPNLKKMLQGYLVEEKE